MSMLNKHPEWYKKIWSLNIQDMSWVEHTKDEINFIIDIMGFIRNRKNFGFSMWFR